MGKDGLTMEYRNPKTLKHAAKGYITVVTIGDSSAAANPAYGVYAETDDGRMTPWPQVLAGRLQGKKHAWLFYNRAVNGDTLELTRERFDRDALSLDPDIVIIAGGGNNCWDTSQEVTGLAAVDMANAAMQRGIYVIAAPYCGISRAWVERMQMTAGLPAAEKEQIYNNFRIMQDAFESWGSAHGIPIVDASRVIALTDSGLRSDRLRSDFVHPNQSGYNQIALLAEGTLYRMLARMGLEA